MISGIVFSVLSDIHTHFIVLLDGGMGDGEPTIILMILVKFRLD